MSSGSPVLRIVHGARDADDAAVEIAALVAVLAARGASQPAEEPAPRSGWTDRRRAMQQPLAVGRGGWRASGLPR
ncbi:MAG TPA: acyl-CoA carboxylase epsilon subunit [Mycobacteriales bacterium]|nr:acyl-CoA carboxylase epsilon subunit [Mycobacteriales bacterium]